MIRFHLVVFSCSVLLPTVCLQHSSASPVVPVFGPIKRNHLLADVHSTPNKAEN